MATTIPIKMMDGKQIAFSWLDEIRDRAIVRHREKILLTGATGYIGGRLLRNLESDSYPVRCLLRRPEVLSPHAAATTEVVRGDLLKPETLPATMRGVTAAYYLVHSMGSGGNYAHEDRSAAKAFSSAARDAGVGRIIYLGGLGSGKRLSGHRRSRQEVGRILRSSGVSTIEFRASIIIGSGSLSFEMIRSLVEKLPVMLTPRWVHTMSQPIAVEDVIGIRPPGIPGSGLLVHALPGAPDRLRTPAPGNRVPGSSGGMGRRAIRRLTVAHLWRGRRGDKTVPSPSTHRTRRWRRAYREYVRR